MKIWAKEGDEVTCINGHRICTIAKDINEGQSHQPEFFHDWTQSSTCPCKTCGAKFFEPIWSEVKDFPDGEATIIHPVRVHFSDGWR